MEITQAGRNFRSLDRKTAEVINVTTNSKLNYPEGQEAVDMCAAIEEMRMDSKAEGFIEGKTAGMLEGKTAGMLEGEINGRIKGSVETYREFGCSFHDTARRIAGKFSLPLPEAEAEVGKYWG